MQHFTARVQLLRQANRLEWISAGWLLVEITVALIAGITAHSLARLRRSSDFPRLKSPLAISNGAPIRP